MVMDTCPACGKDITEDVTVCPDCGASLDEPTGSFPAVGRVEEEAGLWDDIDGPVLVVRKGPEVGERFYIDRPRLTIGRDPASSIFLNDITVSRNHAVLEEAEDEITVEDAGSLNGTYVNGVSVDRAILHTGDDLQIGRFHMVFLGGGEA
jgi:hypothetical protein